MSVELSVRGQILREAAQKLAQEIVESSEFCWVYEDPELEDLPFEDQEDIHGLLQGARVTLSWDHLE